VKKKDKFAGKENDAALNANVSEMGRSRPARVHWCFKKGGKDAVESRLGTVRKTGSFSVKKGVSRTACRACMER